MDSAAQTQPQLSAQQGTFGQAIGTGPMMMQNRGPMQQGMEMNQLPGQMQMMPAGPTMQGGAGPGLPPFAAMGQIPQYGAINPNIRLPPGIAGGGNQPPGFAFRNAEAMNIAGPNMPGGQMSIDQVYSSGTPQRSAIGGATEASSKISVGGWVIIGIAIITAILIIVFILSMIFGGKKPAATLTPSSYRQGRRRAGVGAGTGEGEEDAAQSERGRLGLPGSDYANREGYEGGNDPNPARYGRDSGPMEGFQSPPSKYYGERRSYHPPIGNESRYLSDDRPEEDEYENQLNRPRLGAPKIIRPTEEDEHVMGRPPSGKARRKPSQQDIYRQSVGQYEEEPQARSGRRVHYEDDASVDELVQRGGRRPHSVPREEREEPLPIEERLMKPSTEARTMKGTFSKDQSAPIQGSARQPGPASISGRGGASFNPPLGGRMRAPVTPVTASGGQDLLRDVNS
jgi:hypothetical protein